MKTYEVEIVGLVPMLWHQDNIDFSDETKIWQQKNKKKSKAGDDRSPAWTWLGYVYHDGEHFALPQDVISSNWMRGAVNVIVKGNKSFKSQTQSGIMIREPFLDLYNKGKLIPWGPFEDLIGNEGFYAHRKLAEENGFSLYVKRAKVGQSKHVRVRPRFDQWAFRLTIDVIDDQITMEVLTDILHYSGRYVGLGDWRPGSPKSPGPWGRYEAKIREITEEKAA